MWLIIIIPIIYLNLPNNVQLQTKNYKWSVKHAQNNPK